MLCCNAWCESTHILPANGTSCLSISETRSAKQFSDWLTFQIQKDTFSLLVRAPWSPHVSQSDSPSDAWAFHFWKTKWWAIQLISQNKKKAIGKSQTFLCESDALVHQARPWEVCPYQDDPGGASANSWMQGGPAQTYSPGWASAACLAWIFGSRPNIATGHLLDRVRQKFPDLGHNLQNQTK